MLPWCYAGFIPRKRNVSKCLRFDDLLGSVVVSHMLLLLLSPCRNLLVFLEVPGILLGCTVDRE